MERIENKEMLGVLNVPRKKSRQMLSGVDLFHHTYLFMEKELGGKLSSLDFHFRRPLFTSPLLRFVDAPKIQEASAVFHFNFKDKKKVIGLFESESNATEVYSDNEQATQAKLNFVRDKVVCCGNFEVNPIQVLATASKYLLHRRIHGADSRDPILLRIELDHYTPSMREMDFQLETPAHNLRRFHITYVNSKKSLVGRMHWLLSEKKWH